MSGNECAANLRELAERLERVERENRRMKVAGGAVILAMVLRYAHLSPEHRRAAVAKLDDLDTNVDTYVDTKTV